MAWKRGLCLIYGPRILEAVSLSMLSHRANPDTDRSEEELWYSKSWN